MVDLDGTLCRLIDGRLPSSRVHGDDRVVALLDHRPVNPARPTARPPPEAIGHVHLHVVPRLVGDSVLGTPRLDTRV